MNYIKRIYSKLFFFAIGLSISVNSFAQQKIIYMRAFNYIKMQNAVNEFTASDTIKHLDLADFTEKLSIYWDQDKKNVERTLDSIDWSQRQYKWQFSFLKHLTTGRKEPTQIIFFSNIFKNMLVAEVMPIKKHENMSLYTQSLFNRSEEYLFLFDSEAKIKKVFNLKMQYN